MARNRPADTPRSIEIIPSFIPRHPANVLYMSGDTRVLCAATLTRGVPPFLEGKGRGWATAEYSLLPVSTLPRAGRDRNGKISGRTKGNEDPLFLFNIIESALEDFTGKLSESRPRISVLPTRNGLDDAAELLDSSISSIWDRNEVEYKTERLAKFMAIAGVAFVGTPFNRSLMNGVGDVDFVVKDPRMCSVDIGVMETDKIDRGEYLIIEDFLPLDAQKFLYPGRASEMKPDERVSGFTTTPSRSAGHILRAAYHRLTKGRDGTKRSAIPKVIIKEFYVQDRRKSMEDHGVVPMVHGITKPAEKGLPFPCLPANVCL